MSNDTITYSSELMKNYKQAELMSPEKRFEALQTNTGHPLLFSIGTDNIFYVTQETPGHSTGWVKTDLSSAQIAEDFQGQSNVTCKTFEVSQNAKDGTIGIAMVINDTKNDHLYLCLDNSNTDMSWLGKPNWVSFPYDDADHPLSAVNIVNVFISETSSKVQYIVADVLRDPSSAEKLVFRHYIDTAKTGGFAWYPHDVSFDLEADSYSSCLGREAAQLIDGLYTSGQVSGNAQFIYQPLYNVWDPSTPPSPARLKLPGGIVPDAMAVVRNSDLSTDLYVSAKGGLYYFASSNQKDGAEAVLLLKNDMFNGVTKLFAFSANGNIIVWGLNADDEIFYVACPANQINIPTSWSYPVPILTDVDMVSPYVNRVNNGNTFFAVAGNELKVMARSRYTTTWKSQSITLPAPETAKAQKFSSYTTRIQVKDVNDQPVTNTPISLSAHARTAVYINHLYYILDTTPIQIKTDELGSITIVEWVDGLQCAQLIVNGRDGQHIQINPMDKPFNKVAKLNTVDSLRNATITSSDGSTKPLVADGTKDSDLQTVADGNGQLSKAYSKIAATSRLTAFPNKTSFTGAASLQATSTSAVEDIGDGILVAAGDLFKWLESGVESVIKIVEDAASGVWHFIATIEGKVYRAVLDTVETVVGAVEWVFNAIKTATEDLIKFLEFLFEWNDITRTQKVLKNLSKLYLQNQVDEIEVIKEQFNEMINDAVKAVNKWAGITDWSGLGSAATVPVNSNSTPTDGLSSSTTFLSHHFQNNASSIKQTNPPSPPDPNQSPIDTLFQALKNEGTIISEVITQLEELSNDYSNLSLSDVLKKLVAILADGVLESAENVIDALFDILYEIASAALEVLDTPIYIPVISDILNDFGVPDLSMLDLFCWIAAVPVTIIYKMANGSAPFPEDDNTSFLIDATGYQTVVQAFAATQSAYMTYMTADSALGSGPIQMPESVSSAVFVTGHMFSGFFTLMSNFVAPFEAAVEIGANPFAVPSAILGILSGVTDGLATTLVPKYPIKNEVISWVNRVTLGIRLLAKMIFSGPAQKKFGTTTSVMSKLKVGDGRATGSIVDSILVIPALFCTCWHFYELSEDPAGKERSEAIIEETSYIAAYISRVSYATAVNVEEPEVKVAAIVVMVVANVCYSGLQTAEAIVD